MNIELCHIDPVDRAADLFEVTVQDSAGTKLAIFRCSGEGNARRLRDAIRDYADELRRVFDAGRSAKRS